MHLRDESFFSCIYLYKRYSKVKSYTRRSKKIRNENWGGVHLSMMISINMQNLI